jgi:predicted dithiol-disulfide oxidoreductase (DUF899 family)
MQHQIASRAAWQRARIDLLARERAFTKMQDDLNAARRALPWVRIEKEYVFDGTNGKVTLADMFRGRSQLFVKHFMMGPGQQHQCVGCSFEVDHMTGILDHLENHDIAYAVVARARIDEIEAYRRRMGWNVNWVSSYPNNFNFDFHVSFTDEEMVAGKAWFNYREISPPLQDLSGNSVFYKDETGQIFHTYSSYTRGSEMFLGAYAYIDVTPKGRAESGPTFTLADWVRPHDMYGKGGMVEPTGRYHTAECGCGAHKAAE